MLFINFLQFPAKKFKLFLNCKGQFSQNWVNISANNARKHLFPWMLSRFVCWGRNKSFTMVHKHLLLINFRSILQVALNLLYLPTFWTNSFESLNFLNFVLRNVGWNVVRYIANQGKNVSSICTCLNYWLYKLIYQ